MFWILGYDIILNIILQNMIVNAPESAVSIVSISYTIFHVKCPLKSQYWSEHKHAVLVPGSP